jgi:hypothetical protein
VRAGFAGLAIRVQVAGDQCEVAQNQQAVNSCQGVEADSGESEVFVDQKHDQPNSDNDALLQQERSLPDFQQKGHEGIGLGASTLQPEEREERIEDIQDEYAE